MSRFGIARICACGTLSFVEGIDELVSISSAGLILLTVLDSRSPIINTCIRAAEWNNRFRCGLTVARAALP